MKELGVFDLYSRDKKYSEQGEAPEVYQYYEMPKGVRVQVIGIWRKAIGPYSYRSHDNANAWWRFIHGTLAHEKGVFELSSTGMTPLEKCEAFLLNADSIDDCLDIIQFTFRIISKPIANMSPYQRKEQGIKQDPEDAIAELNFRLLEAAIGYQFENGKIIRIDSQFVSSQ